MRTAVIVRLVCVCAAGVAGVLLAQDFSRLSDDDRKQVNDWMLERTQRMMAAHQLDKELSQVWADERYTSPEIAALRARHRALQQELADVQAALQEKVLGLPELQEKKKQLEEDRKNIRELAEKVKEKTGPDR